MNIVVAREEDQENKLYQKVVEEYQQEETKRSLQKHQRRQCSSLGNIW